MVSLVVTGRKGALMQLNNLKIQSLTRSGKYSDGGGLYLKVSSRGEKSWIFRFMLDKKSHDMGLGSLKVIPLKQARLKAADCRRLLAEGINPLAEKQKRENARRQQSASSLTFDRCAEMYFEQKHTEWKNQKYRQQWLNDLKKYASPHFGNISIQGLDASMVIKALDPIWNTIPTTADRLRSRIESVFNWAKARGYCKQENPALWRGHLDKIFSKPSKVKKVEHHTSLEYDDIKKFMEDLKKQKGLAAKALEFCILTATRSGEVRGAKWSEINLNDKVWIIPPERMKAGKEHRVPLTERCMVILKEMQSYSLDEFVFPSSKAGRPLSDMTLLKVLKRMECAVTVHGFRATFKTWASETISVPNDVVEAALAHRNKNKVEAAYQRGDLFNKRRELMRQWEHFCLSPTSRILPIKTTEKDNTNVG